MLDESEEVGQHDVEYDDVSNVHTHHHPTVLAPISISVSIGLVA
jgi:hypothetical protein